MVPVAEIGYEVEMQENVCTDDIRKNIQMVLSFG